MSDPLSVLARLRKAFNHHDLDTLALCFSPRAVLVAPDGLGQDREEIVSYYAEFIDAFPDSHCTPQTVTVLGDTLIAEYTLTGTNSGPWLMPGGGYLDPTSRPITVRACSVSSVEHGYIVSHRIFYDQLELAAQLGACLWFPHPHEQAAPGRTTREPAQLQ
ncbi:ester cyclase [Sphaerisporangium aureirubrum]|uniref:Ester cyclase n=1 Tax=Sphaerisporangium aureirubrum TaxID=1544736 RepID=A0ABW1NCS9_9ACTN